ncbi:exo-beta-N-acetylmuramidase NamZ family protein [Verrucomicrobiota bacterium sgz303538]
MLSRLLCIGLVLLTLSLPTRAAIQLGIDRLQQMEFAPLMGKRVGLVTNQTGVNTEGVKTRQILRNAKGVNLVALFTPEHGLDGTELAGRYVSTRRDALTGLTAYSLYGPTRKPTPEMLRGIDVLVYDMQDIGVRSYTYISTMARCMEAAGEAGIEFMVLDRPNPLGGIRVEGPPVESSLISFVGQLPVPYVHGLTCGELAKMLNEKGWMAARCRLSIIEMKGWNRRMVWDDTGLRWVRTSPNIPRSTSPAYYVATGIVGSLAGLETGVGGVEPFEVCAAPWLDAGEFTSYVRGLRISGVVATPFSEGSFRGCRLRIDPRTAGNLTGLATGLLAEVNRRAGRPNLFERSPKDKLDIFFKVYGSRSIRDQLDNGTPLPRLVQSWESTVNRFETARGPYLLY